MVTWDNTVPECGIDNCKELHHRLLHKDKSGHFTTENKEALPEKDELCLHSKFEAANKNCAPNEGELKNTSKSAAQDKSYTTITTNPGTIALSQCT